MSDPKIMERTSSEQEFQYIRDRINSALGTSFREGSDLRRWLHGELRGEHVPLLISIIENCKTFWPRWTCVALFGCIQGRFDATYLSRLFDELPETAIDYELRWRVADVINGYGGKPQNVSGWLLERVRDPSIGKPKEMLILALKHLPKDEAAKAAMEVFDEHPGHAAITIGKTADESAIPFLERKLKQAEEAKNFAWIRTEIRTAIKRIQRRAEKESAKLSQ